MARHRRYVLHMFAKNSGKRVREGSQAICPFIFLLLRLQLDQFFEVPDQPTGGSLLAVFVNLATLSSIFRPRIARSLNKVIVYGDRSRTWPGASGQVDEHIQVGHPRPLLGLPFGIRFHEMHHRH